MRKLTIALALLNSSPLSPVDCGAQGRSCYKQNNIQAVRRSGPRPYGKASVQSGSGAYVVMLDEGSVALVEATLVDGPILVAAPVSTCR